MEGQHGEDSSFLHPNGVSVSTSNIPIPTHHIYATPCIGKTDKNIVNYSKNPCNNDQYFIKKRGSFLGSVQFGEETVMPFHQEGKDKRSSNTLNKATFLTSFHVDPIYKLESNSSIVARRLLKESELFLPGRHAEIKKEEQDNIWRGSYSEEGSVYSSFGTVSDLEHDNTDMSMASSNSDLACLQIGDVECNGDILSMFNRESLIDNTFCNPSCIETKEKEVLKGEESNNRVSLEYIPSSFKNSKNNEVTRKDSMCKEEILYKYPINNSGLKRRSVSAHELRFLDTNNGSVYSALDDSLPCTYRCCCCLSINKQSDLNANRDEADYLLTCEKGDFKMKPLNQPKPPPRSSSLPDLYFYDDEEEEKDWESSSKQDRAFEIHSSMHDSNMTDNNQNKIGDLFDLCHYNISQDEKEHYFVSLNGQSEANKRVNYHPPVPLDRTTFISRNDPNRFSIISSKARQMTRRIGSTSDCSKYLGNYCTGNWPFLCSSANLPYSLHADADDYEDGGGVGAISGGSSKSLIACNFDSPYVSDDLLNNVHHYLTEDNLSLKEGISYQIVFAFNDIKYSLLISFT